MRLSDKDIQECLESGELVVVGPRGDIPFDRYKQVQPCSIDLRLDSQFYEYRSDIEQFDVKELDNIWNYADRFQVEDGQQVIINSNSILFGQIYEQLRIPSNVSGKIVGRSRFARLGLSIHATGDFINPEFEGAMPLQIINHNKFPIVIYPYMTICQLILVQLTSKPLVPYPMKSSNPYHKERLASPSVCHKDPVINLINEENSIYKETEKRLVDRYLKQKETSELIKGLTVNFEKEAENRKSESGNTIVIKDSSLGAINLGQLFGDVKTKISNLHNDPKYEVKESLEKIIEFLGSTENGLDTVKKSQALELVSDLTSLATLPQENRTSKTTTSVIINSLSEILKTSAAGSTLWQHWGAAISSYFGF